MPWPGDIIEGIAEGDGSFIWAKARAELNLQLRRIHQISDHVWMKVRRGESTLKLRVCVVPDANATLHKYFTVRAATDERHVAVLADMTFQECFELQGETWFLISRRANYKYWTFVLFNSNFVVVEI